MTLSKPTRANALLGFVVVLLATMTALQYGWIGELSAFQRQQIERTLRTSTDRFVRDIDGELERLWYTFRVRRGRHAGEEISEEFADWVDAFDYPQLVDGAFWVREVETPADDRIRRQGTTASDRDPTTRSLALERISLEDGRFEPAEWPPWLENLRGALVESATNHRGRDFHSSDSFTADLDAQRVAFVVAQTDFDQKTWAVVIMRRAVLVEQFLPAMVNSHFGADEERNFEVRIFDEATDDRVVYTSTADQPSDAGPPDTIRHFRDFGGVYLPNENDGRRSLAVAVTHRAGSVDTAVAQLRFRNLALSFGAVLVLGASVGVIAIAAQRARRLAARQMEFVAGVSHELRTPIAGITSLSQNLADGVVQDMDHAARYGRAIHQEGRRLANMVEGVLHFSAIRSGHYRYEMRELDVADLVDAALQTFDAEAPANRRLRVEIPNDLPPVLGDVRALQSVVRNLVSNAMKFSAEKDEVRIFASTGGDTGAGEIELCVADSGPGIDPAEMRHVFEPFFRGRSARGEQVEGSGLGLSLVKEIVDAHKGRIEIAGNAGKGTVFRVRLPTVRPSTASEPARRVRPLQPAGEGSDAL